MKQYTYQELNALPVTELAKLQTEILDIFVADERERQNKISDILRLQSLGSLWAMNNKRKP